MHVSTLYLTARHMVTRVGGCDESQMHRALHEPTGDGTCKHCGGAFLKRGSRKKFCSTTCAMQAQRRRPL